MTDTCSSRGRPGGRRRSRSTTGALRAAATRFCLAFACAAMLAACGGGAGPLPPAPAPTETTYRLGPGDQVRINVFNEPDLSGEYRLDGNGNLTLPLIGVAEAGGLTSEELTRSLEKKFAEYLKSPNISVAILNYRPFYIVGEVQRPGNYPYVDGMTVINAIAIAGGFTYRANTRNFYIQRKAESDEQFAAQQQTGVMPGDVVVVRERFF